MENISERHNLKIPFKNYRDYDYPKKILKI